MYRYKYNIIFISNNQLEDMMEDFVYNDNEKMDYLEISLRLNMKIYIQDIKVLLNLNEKLNK